MKTPLWYTITTMDKQSAVSLPTGALAYLGDSLHSVYVRRRLMSEHDFKANRLSQIEREYVCAHNQAHLLESISGELTEEEAAIVARARNLRTNNKPKNTPRSEYKQATAFEALLGYLELTEQRERLKHILEVTYKEYTE